MKQKNIIFGLLTSASLLYSTGFEYTLNDEWKELLAPIKGVLSDSQLAKFTLCNYEKDSRVTLHEYKKYFPNVMRNMAGEDIMMKDMKFNKIEKDKIILTFKISYNYSETKVKALLERNEKQEAYNCLITSRVKMDSYEEGVKQCLGRDNCLPTAFDLALQMDDFFKKRIKKERKYDDGF